MKDREVNPLLYSLWASSYAICQLLALLPEADITSEIRNISIDQLQVIDFIIQHDALQDLDIERFIDHCHSIIQQTENMLEKKDQK